ncbi:hypothetical protein [Pseudoduganella sp. RAF53_2]|uniref:hypothetical protein n=1 Tax=unclassified Pseudoduganella TaxID=2637179 RepID=UPI003F976C98
MRLLQWIGILAFAVAANAAQAEARILLVHPSAPQIPANLLRISIEFAAPIEGPVLPRLALMHADGAAIQEPFLEQELWSPDGRILTVLLHPGRVKSGLNAHDELGPILAEQDDVVLTLDGAPVRQWHVGAAKTDGPAASAWKLSAVHRASRQVLVVTLDGPIDGRDAGYLAIVDGHGRRVEGRAGLQQGESVWTFTPQKPWRAGKYQLVVRGTLEDAAGNRLNGHFETSADMPRGPAADEAVAFSVD